MVRRKKGLTAAKAIVAYTRVSTNGQGQHGHSLPEQEARIRAWAAGAGLAVAALYTDTASGAKSSRAGLAAALTDVCARGGVLAVVSLSRVARSTKDMLAIAERLERAGADLVSLSERIDTTTAAGKMTFRMLAVLNEFERDLARERTKATAAHLRRNARRISRFAPFGWDFDGKALIPNPAEQRVVALIHAWDEAGRSLREIGALLEADGVKPKNGGRRWSASVVRSVLLRERLAA